ncbi:MAG: TetR/AcrR family transcriptional regulator [Acidobacteria bacterium]|nr:TetR/AcrR family transcriptional regulator [Acidobacteriota bacterium]
MRKLPKADRRKAIVEAAAALFAERGFRGVTTKELAQRVGVTEPVLYTHFKTKRDLYSAIIDGASNEAFDLVRERLRQSALTDPPKVFFQKLATLIVENQVRHPEYIRLILFSALEKHELSELCFERHAQVIYSIVIEYLKRQMKAGTVRKLDPTLAARVFVGTVHHYCIFELHFGFKIVRASRKRAVENMVGIFLNGIQSV